jgi:hypothetical protein
MWSTCWTAKIACGAEFPDKRALSRECSAALTYVSLILFFFFIFLPHFCPGVVPIYLAAETQARPTQRADACSDLAAASRATATSNDVCPCVASKLENRL